MVKPQARPIKTSRSCCVVELIRDVAVPPAWYQALVSIPGRESSYQKTWNAVGGVIDSHQAADIVNWIAATVSYAIIDLAGVQGVLGSQT